MYKLLLLKNNSSAYTLPFAGACWVSLGQINFCGHPQESDFSKMQSFAS